MKFDLTSLAGLSVSQATLRMWVNSGSADVQNLKQVASTAWTENAITYANRPATGVTISTFTYSGPTGAWNELNVTSAVAASAGAYMSIAIDNSGNDGYRFNSDEAASNRLELVVNWSGGSGGPTPTATPTATPSPTPTATPTRTPTPAPSTPTPTPGPGGSFSFGVAGDIGQNSNTTAVLNAINASGANFFLAIGDLSYAGSGSETAWCNFIKNVVGQTYPYELVAGNHEDDGPDGLISNYVMCLPHRLTTLTGTYGKEFYFNYPATNPLVRFINISPNLTFPGEGTWSYSAGGARYNWVANAIDSARAAGIPWVVVTMHKFCIALVSSGSCEVGTDIMNLLVSKKVDLYFQAHDHSYARGKQLALGTGCSAIPTGSFDPDCVADATAPFAKGAGTVISTVGTGGQSLSSQNSGDPEAPYFQTFMSSNLTYGFMKVTVSSTSLNVQFVRGAGGSFTDSFTIQ
jgi:hypothetical protein